MMVKLRTVWVHQWVTDLVGYTDSAARRRDFKVGRVSLVRQDFCVVGSVARNLGGVE